VSHETIRFEVADGVARLTLARPQALNSFTGHMHREVREVLTAAAADRAVRAVLLTGEGRGFCAGQDLNERTVSSGEQAPDLGASLEENWNPLIRLITGMEKPVVCAVNGVAAGAGANIALACDIVIAARTARFIESFARLGLIPDSGGTWILPRLVGMARARAIAMLAPTISAEQALAWGMIWQVVDDEELEATATALAARLATQATRGFALTKRAFAASAANDLDAQLELETTLMREAGRSADYREGVAAFLEKREPRYRGE
jgi:2-(1,2-epoxy-1,2-dihydrophenyl)acetyl-CoA isomerase